MNNNLEKLFIRAGVVNYFLIFFYVIHGITGCLERPPADDQQGAQPIFPLYPPDIR